MKTLTKKILAICAIVSCLASLASAAPPNLITYQGRLKENNQPVTGNRLIEIFLCDDPSAGSCTSTGAQDFYVSTGLFKSTFTVPGTVNLPVGNWWLELKVGTQVLSPREQLSSVPYALLAATAAYVSGAVSKTGDSMTGQLTLNNSSMTIVGPSGASPGVLWVSTTASQPLLYVSTQGFTGINTSSPQYPLHIASKLGTQVALRVDGYDASYDSIYINSNGSGRPAYGYVKGTLVALTYADAAGFHVDVAGDEKLTITADSRVGIKNISPSYRLHVSSGAGETGTVMAVSTGATNLFWVAGDGAHALKYYGDGSTLTGVVATGIPADISVSTIAASAATPYGGVNISSNVFIAGNVGIGTTNPVDLFEVAGSLGNIGIPTNGNSIRYTYNGANFIQADGALSELRIRTGGTDRMVIKTAGNVGVGTTAPASKLEVAGGSVTISGAEAGLLFDGPFRKIAPTTSVAEGAGLYVSTHVYIIGFSSAAKYYGDGSALTGVTASGAVQKIGDTMTGDLFMSGGSSISVTGAIGIATSAPSAQLAIEYVWPTQTPLIKVWEPSAGYTFGLDEFAQLYYGPSLNYGAGSIVNFGGNQTQVGTNAIMFHLYPQSVASGGYLLKAQDGADVRLAIDSEGHVGVGTAAPTSKFDVLGGSITIRGTNAALVFEDSSRVISSETAAGLGAGIRVSTNVYIVGFSSAAKYYGDGSGLINLPGPGNMATTDTFQVISGTKTFTGQLVLNSTLTVIAPTNASSSLWVSTSVTTPHLYVSTGGNAGIGTANPSFRLDVAGALRAQGGATASRIEGTPANPVLELWASPADTNKQFLFWVPNDNRLRLDRDNGAGEIISFWDNGNVTTPGNVGIGTTGPLSKFDVLDGSITIRGANAALVFEDSSRVISSETAANLGAGIRVSTNVYIVGFSSAAKYYGDGSGLINLPGPGNMATTDTSQVISGTKTFTGLLDLNAILTVVAPINAATSLWVSTSLSTPHLFVSTGGNVGIRTASPEKALHIVAVNGSGIELQIPSFGLGDRSSVFFSADNGARDVAQIAAETAVSGGGIFHFLTSSNGVLPSVERLTIDNSGNVGIGATTPGEKLDVAGVIRSSSSIYPGAGGGFQTLRGMYDDSAKYSTGFSSNVYIVGFSSAAKYYGDGSGLTNLPAPANMATTDTSQVISGTKTFTGQLVLNSTLTIIAPTNAASSLWVSTSATTPHLYISTLGNVGIGTANPIRPLTVLQNDALTEIALFTMATGSGIMIQPGEILGYNGLGYNDLGLRANSGAPLLYLTTGGNVGIGTTSPGVKLEVAGEIKASSISVAGLIRSSSTIFPGAGGVFQTLRGMYDDPAKYSTGFSSNVYIVGFSSAAKYYGDGSGLTGVPGDGLGSHVATTTLQMGAYGVNTSSNITAARYQISGNTMVAILPGIDSIAYGVGAGNTGGNYNVFIGNYAGAANTTGSYNTATGLSALYSNTTGNYNTATGTQALFYNETGAANSVFGVNAGGLGTAALNSFSSSTIMGYQAGYFLSNGSADNIFVGFKAGYNVTTGTGNIVIGYNKDTSAPTASNQLNIGGVLYGDLSAKTIGISTRAPQAALDIVSTGTASNIYAQIWRDGSGTVVASMTSTGVMTASTFNAVGSAYMMNGQVVIDSQRNVFAKSMAVENSMGVSSLTISGSEFSVGASTFVVKNGNVGIGTATPNYKLDMGGFEIGGVSTITMLNGSIAIVPPGTGGSNAGYGISIGSNSYSNYDYGVGVGYGTNNNYTFGVGLGNGASNNNAYGVGVGVYASGNNTSGVGVGNNASANYNWGVGVGGNAYGNSNYAVGIGANSQNNQTYGSALGAYSYAASSSVALGSYAKANARDSIAIGAWTVNNSTGTASFGSYAVTTSSDITAARYFGDGSALNGVISTSAVQKTGDTMSGLFSIQAGTLTISNSSMFFAVRGDGSVVSTGTYAGGGLIPAQGTGERFMWWPNKAAIRAGGVVGANWDDSSVGAYSTAFGYDNNASGSYATAVGGYGNRATGSLMPFTGGGQYNTASADYSFAGGGYFNVVSGSNSVIAGGAYNVTQGTSAVVAGGEVNRADGKYSAVVGGNLNKALGDNSFAGGGKSNQAQGLYSFVGGGGPSGANPGNTATADYAAIVGGSSNTADSNAWMSFIGGGSGNTISGQQVVISGGMDNRAGTASNYYSVVAGGWGNRSVGDSSVVGGGGGNTASGSSSVVPGGMYNTAQGNYSFAAGYRSSSTAQGTFTWSDSSGDRVDNNVLNRTWFKSSGGFLVTASTEPSANGSLTVGNMGLSSFTVQVNGNLSLGNGGPGGNTPVTVTLVNRTGGSAGYGDIVVIDSLNDNSFNYTTTPSSTTVLGVVYDQTITNLSGGKIAIHGVVKIKTNTSVTRGQAVITSGVPGQAGVNLSPAPGTSIGKWLQSGGGGGALMEAVLLSQ